MTILFDATEKTSQTRPFGSGILAWCPTYHADHTAEDEAWWAEECRRREEEAIDWDAEFERVRWQELIEAGYRPF